MVPAQVPFPQPAPSAQTKDGDANRVLGIVGFVMALFPFTTLIGLILSIIAIVRSRKAGAPNGFARAGVIIGALGVLIAIIIVIALIDNVSALIETCRELGVGVHEVGNATYTCTETSSHVVYR